MDRIAVKHSRAVEVLPFHRQWDEWAQSGYAAFLSSVDFEFHDRTPVNITWVNLRVSIGGLMAELRKQAPCMSVTQGIEEMVVKIKVPMKCTVNSKVAVNQCPM